VEKIPFFFFILHVEITFFVVRWVEFVFKRISGVGFFCTRNYGSTLVDPLVVLGSVGEGKVKKKGVPQGLPPPPREPPRVFPFSQGSFRGRKWGLLFPG